MEELIVHLSRFEKTLARGAEWPVAVPVWLVVQLESGMAYVRGGGLTADLPPRSPVIVPPNTPVTFLASVLGEVGLRGLPIKVSSLSGLLTLGERACLEDAAARECAPFRQLMAGHPLAAGLGEWLSSEQTPSLPVRLGFLQAFAEWLSPFLARTATPQPNPAEQEPKARLRQLIEQMPESELAALSLRELARQLCCCERHANRLFHSVCGCSFRKHVKELRLRRACQMLVHGHYKIIDVALESGHTSLALFNYSFKNRFRMTPTEWRERHLTRNGRAVRPARHPVLA